MNAPSDRPELSVVVPVFNEERCIGPLVAALEPVLEATVSDHEIILVDDGSSDRTWAAITELALRHPRIRGLSLLRNFGHQGALLAGLSEASGRAVVTMDGDLQHPPEVITALVEAWRDGAPIVNTERIDSADAGWFKRTSSRLFYRLFSRLSGLEMRPGSSDFRLLDRGVVETLLAMQSNDPFLRGAIEWLAGDAARRVTYRAAERFAGTSKFSLRKMIRLSIDGLTSFSTVPLKLGIWLGLATSGLAFLEILYILMQYARGETVPGWASVLTVTSFMFGILFLLFGILGSYLASVHRALQSRPQFVPAQRVGWTKGRRSWPVLERSA